MQYTSYTYIHTCTHIPPLTMPVILSFDLLTSFQNPK